MGFLALSHTNNWQTTTKKEIVGWIFKNGKCSLNFNLTSTNELYSRCRRLLELD